MSSLGRASRKMELIPEAEMSQDLPSASWGRKTALGPES